MAVSQTTDGFTLPCGRQLEALWQRIDGGGIAEPDDHERGCPHCRTAVASLTTLWRATRALAAEPVTVPPDLTQRIMAAVRAEVRRNRMVPLPTRPPGRVEISDQAVAVVLRFAADSVEGVRARRCAVRPHEEGRGDAEGVTAPNRGRPLTGVIDVRLSVAVRYGAGPVDDLLTAVRRAVAAAADARIGLRIARCDVVVEDVYL